MGPTEFFRPTSSKVLAVSVWAIIVLISASGVISSHGVHKLQVISLAVFFATVVWIFYWRPSVEISDGGITFVNPLRRIHIPWPAVTQLAIRGTFEVTDRSSKRYSAYAAPIRNKRDDLGIAGVVKQVADARFDALTRAGFLDDIRPEGAPVTIQRNVVGLALLGLACATLLITLAV